MSEPEVNKWLMTTDDLMDEELDAKASLLWEEGARQVLGDAEFERLYRRTPCHSTATDGSTANERT